ncbi:helix-turn-helix domain-containing protein [Paenibacillus terreus]|uniref:Helix-turn-helix domain-containing protein n=1 Tax=Paenibacillus terreus TaxID=1387834 RepID=A0ABV5BAD6_9BACL
MNLYESSILNAVAYMEERMDKEITLDEIASVAAFSKFHFTRLFKSIARESISEYIRKRRLTLAARALIETDAPILELSLCFGYSSQEAFTRAFKSYIGMSPQSYRQKGSHHHNLYKESLTDTLAKLTKQESTCRVRIIEQPSFLIGGIALGEMLSNHAISRLWNRFYEGLAKCGIDPETAVCYGYESLDDDDSSYYVAGIPVPSLEQLPDGWTGIHVPEHKYAAFELDNIIEHIPYVLEEIYKNQLPAMNLKPVSNFSLEFYDENYSTNDKNKQHSNFNSC